MTSQILTCPECQKSYDSNFAFCPYCGTPNSFGLNGQSATAQIDKLEPALKIEAPPDALPPHTITFKFQDSVELLQIPALEPILLGRGEQMSGTRSVDLTPYNAAEKGVSRRHALIVPQGKNYAIQDLRSTNWTWLHGKRLLPSKTYPLKSGDHVQLGSLSFNIFFKTS